MTVSKPVSHHGSPGVKSRYELAGLLDIERPLFEAPDSRTRMLVTVGNAASRRDNAIQPIEPLRALEHRKIRNERCMRTLESTPPPWCSAGAALGAASSQRQISHQAPVDFKATGTSQ